MKIPLLRNRMAVALLCALLLTAGQVWAEAAGRVMAVSGIARAIDIRGTERVLVKGGEIHSGDRIVTDEGALVQLMMADGGYLSVRSGTELTIASFVKDEKNWKNSNFLIDLAKGGFRSISGLIGRHNRDGYKITAATATIGIRGTDHEPMLILPAAAGQAMPNPPGVYDKVNQGETFIRNELGTLSLKVGQVGFAPIKPEIAPAVLPRVPDFYNPTPRTDARGGDRQQEGRGDGKGDARRLGQGESGPGSRGEGTGKDGDRRNGNPVGGARPPETGAPNRPGLTRPQGGMGAVGPMNGSSMPPRPAGAEPMRTGTQLPGAILPPPPAPTGTLTTTTVLPPPPPPSGTTSTTILPK